ncbi:SDR family NAD(P)-dependent oxidoreductase [Pseudonocardia alaniniphila]|uniref:SDR family NAD(P)-dependent oxidoreductase n=1 Tax=Pseudonocardia alaniniphila TaxID=75291 RepID=A0ABS9TI78_9PSEU|nr:SDR family NAD(P)-dependent oxidoreductase [Pseudonocardia alaniniphila]MCH6168247.1 SDR family NAD(P)-dependent oxidoreductase [Pseudonocardia alaniniphila]
MAATGTSASAGPGIGAGDRVIVTGAAGGLASPAVARLREQGVQVIGLDVIGDEHTIACDITDDAAVSRAVAEAAQRLGGLDAVVHFAGIGIPNDAGASLVPDALRVIDVNLLGAWRVTAAALSALLDGRAARGGRKGRVVFVASELAYLTLPFVSAYSVAKRGMTAYADALRLEYGSDLHVTTVCPGYVRTPIHDAGRQVGLALEGQVRREEVEDVVATVLRALTAARPRRETACTPGGAVELWVGRHLPGLLGSAVARRIRGRAAAGHFDGSPVAAGLVRRLTDRMNGPATSTDTTAPATERSAS